MRKMFAPNYTVSDRLLSAIAEIESLHTLVAQTRLLPKREADLHHRALVETAHSSTSIEGNTLTLKQVDSVLRGKDVTRRKYVETEVRNYKKALDFIDQRKADGMPLVYKDLLALHGLAMKGLIPKGRVGALRIGAINILGRDEKPMYTGPGARAVRKKLEEFLIWINDISVDIHPAVAAALFHYQFVSVHPFAAGNGRAARLATMLYLGLRGYDFKGSIVLDTYYARERSEYFEALHMCQGDMYSEGQDLSPWVSYFVSGFLLSAKVLWAEINVLSTIETLFERKRIGRDEADLLHYAKQYGSVSLSEAEEILPQYSRRTLQRKLKELVDNGCLESAGASRSARYGWRE